MAFTLPGDPGGYVTLDDDGDPIFDSYDNVVSINKNLVVNANATVDGTLTVHADATFDGDVSVAGLITANELQANTVATDNIQDLAVVNDKVDDDAIDGRTVSPDAIDTVHIAANVDILGTLSTGGGIDVGNGSGPAAVDFGAASIVASGGGIATYDATNHQFDGNGTLHGAWLYDGSFGPVSSAALKTGIKKIGLAASYAMIRGLDAVTFRYRAEAQAERNAVYEQTKDGGRRRRRKGRVLPDRHPGLLAEQVEATGELEELIIRKDGEAHGLETPQGWVYLLPALRDIVDRLEKLEASGH